MYGNPYQPQYNPQEAFFRNQMQAIAQPMPQMPAMQPQQFQMMNQQPVPPPQPQLIARAVTSVDEAKAAMIDPLSTNLFTDFANSRIYVKKINNNGLAEFYTFTLDQPQQRQEPTSDPNAAIYERLDRIENMLKDGVASVCKCSAAHADDDKPNGAAKPSRVPKGAADDAGEIAK